ncbi:peptidase M16 [Cephaloticoccus capnophilus]|uniref:Peptidase M16 n=1 Tax=Cephaloticoccus capnophilus TaxID=1548208 RepID=A0A139SNM4_9BACT|nr:insulinase family protein [Cephaloticoccus capnophilus]KXU36084.1 peptidase M16 [Cephaloticoccus capnophilus]
MTRFKPARFHCLFAFALLLPLTGLISRADAPAAETASALAASTNPAASLVPDPVLRTGELPNGLRYAIYPNKEPQGRASLQLVVLAGSLHETEEQRGLAHFLEHMAFNGSTHYPPGTLIEFFQRMGMSFGGDTNAFTSFDRTQYRLELPRTDADTLAEGLRVLSDYAGGLLLLDEEIDRERGVILNEKRARDSVAYRSFVAQFGAMLPAARLPQRLPIGLESVIEEAGRDRFVDFWDTWYRPERMIVVAVGDFDVEAAEGQIRDTFVPLVARAPARELPDMGRVTELEEPHLFYHYEPEAPGTDVILTWLRPYKEAPDSVEKRLAELPRNLALAMLNRRYSELAKGEDAPFNTARATAGDYYRFVEEAEITVSTNPKLWRKALQVGEQELRRALEHGFQPDELAEVVADFKNALAQSVRGAPTRHSSQLSSEIAEALFTDTVFTSPEFDLALLEAPLAQVTPEDCLAALREAFEGDGFYVSVIGNAKLSVDKSGNASAALAEQEILAAFQASHSEPVAPPAVRETSEWAYASWGEPGAVISDERVEDLDLRLVRFANGVRLNLKQTDFEKGPIYVSLRVGEGELTAPAEQAPGIGDLAGATFDAGGLGAHSADELRRILAGHTVGVGFTVGVDAFTLAGATTSEDLRLQLQLMTAKLTDPGWRPEALRQARKQLEQLYLSFKYTTGGPLVTEVANLLASGDPRFGLPEKDVMLSRNLEEAREWIDPELASGPLEVAVVGDFEPEAVIAAVAETLGALPQRAERRALDERKQVRFPAQPFNKNYGIPTEIDKGDVRVYWPSHDALDVRRSRRLSLLGAVLDDRLRLKVRQEIGGSYSPYAGNVASNVFPGYGYFQAICVVDPSQAEQIADLIVEIGDDLARNGVTADELERARQPVMTSVRDSLRNNTYWLRSVLSRAQEKPEVIDWARSRVSDIESITAEELSELAKTYLPATRASRVIILPERPAAAASDVPATE